MTAKGIPELNASSCESEGFSNKYYKTSKAGVKKQQANSLSKADMNKLLNQLPDGAVSAYAGVCADTFYDFYLAKPETMVGVICVTVDCSSETFQKIK